MNLNNISLIETDDNISLYQRRKNFLAVAELSKIKDISNWIEDEKITSHDKWLFFNRLNVPKNLSNKKIGTNIMIRLIKFVDQKKFNIFCPVSPYGVLSYDQLINFYKKFNFINYKDRILIRYCKDV